MYADREGGATTVSIKDRLNLQNAGRRPQFSGKRKSQDDGKWEHDLYDGRVRGTDLRFKLQKKTIQKAKHSRKISILGDTKDLREKLSGTVCRKALEDALRKPKTITEARRPPAMKVAVVEAPVPETKKVASTISKKKALEKVESVDSFLHSLGLEKYALTFEAEEVDMATLLHMNDEDLKALSIPMGPRKKILLALASCV